MVEETVQEAPKQEEELRVLSVNQDGEQKAVDIAEKVRGNKRVAEAKAAGKKVVTYEELSKRVDAIVASIKVVNGTPPLRYSAYDTVAHEHENDSGEWLVIDNLDDVAVEGSVKLFEAFPDGTDFVSPELNSPTWADVCRWTAKMLDHTRYGDHVFLEGLDLTKKRCIGRKKAHDGMKIYTFCMGS